jgi:hypothetical protein
MSFKESEIEGLVFVRKKDPEAPIPSLDQMMRASRDDHPRESCHIPIPKIIDETGARTFSVMN